MTNNTKANKAAESAIRNRSRVHHGQNVEKFREICDLTQQELADILNVRQQQISKWEHTEVLDDKIIEMIADALGIKPELIKNNTRDSIIQIFKVDNIADGGVQYVEGDNAPTYNYNPLDKVTELYDKLREKDQELFLKEKELLEYKMEQMQKEIERLKQ